MPNFKWLPDLQVTTLLAAVLLAVASSAADIDRAVPRDPLRRAYFGDLHLHTADSVDATWGGTRTLPADAYRYAQGLPVTYLGREVKRKAALDFLAVTDHAEYLGVTTRILNKDPAFESSNWYESFTSKGEPGLARLMAAVFRQTERFPELNTEPIKHSNWQRVVDVANQFNRPGKFTTFVAFEWSDTPAGTHNHRVAIFRGPKYPDMAFSALDSRNPVDLWSYADRLRRRGIDSVLIPHNSNLSDGMQFSLNGPDGQPMTRAFAAQKARNELLVEVTQIKGTSETHPELSPDDEFAGFEILEHNVGARRAELHGSYVREALARGLDLAARTGVNPYRFGFVGASDYHSATSATEEDNHTGALGRDDFPFGENAKRIIQDVNPLLRQPIAVLSASGITGVWAEQNTRESIFSAFKRREVFASSGPRMQVRMFGGWRYPEGLMNNADWLRVAYAQGVPMGADLAPRAGRAASQRSKSPRFLVQALKDPNGANLDRIQIVKVWRKDSANHEAVVDVVWSGNRSRDVRTGKVPEVGNTVDVATAEYRNTIGAAQLSAEWVDDHFDPTVAAAYYARVIEIPTPRWPTYVSVRNNLPLTTARPATLQERAWTSPIFYSPH
jgi:Protein of unknown function (DUF3604)